MSISISGLRFYDNTENIPYIERSGAADINFAQEYSGIDYPLPFQYLASDVISSFKAIKIDNNNNSLEEIDLDTSLITSDGTYHICSGVVEYSEFLNLGMYYFIVNDRYQSDNFKVIATKQGVGYDIIECNLIVY